MVAVTDRTDLEGQLRETAQLSGETVRPTDYDIMRRESPTARTQRILRETTPDIVFAMLQKYQEVEKTKRCDKVAMTIVRKEKKTRLRSAGGGEGSHIRGEHPFRGIPGNQ